ncbi:hypothetical protein WN944_016003 [Citrus x changshan-huyou]|uniref:Uncharacterized protein n=1 Tax=Citrus x changshan-huyou TaxID=2935761 RepID=A0AAP0MA25_9ROSI
MLLSGFDSNSVLFDEGEIWTKEPDSTSWHKLRHGFRRASRFQKLRHGFWRASRFQIPHGFLPACLTLPEAPSRLPFSAKVLDPNPKTRMSIEKIMNISWFQKLLQQQRKTGQGSSLFELGVADNNKYILKEKIPDMVSIL